MATNIYLGLPPPNVVKWIKDNYKPVEPDMLNTPLHFVAEEANAKMSFMCDGCGEYEISTTNKEGSWTKYNSNDEITLSNIGDKVYFRAVENVLDNLNWSDYRRFSINNGKIAAKGNIQSLFGKAMTRTDVPRDGYYCLFLDCSALTQAPLLPATTLAQNCYTEMFENCTSLTQAPLLPAIIMANECYTLMFAGCTSLTQAPLLPAIALANQCYGGMFYDCTSLTQAPELPVTTLEMACYESMFRNCTSLIQAPKLLATELKYYCYAYMFDGCTSIPEPRYDMSHMTFEQVVNEIKNTAIFGDEYFGNDNPFKIKCSDKILVAAFDENTYEWTITEE